MEKLDPEGCVELVTDLVHEHGELVFRNSWNGGAPGLSGCDTIHKLSWAYIVHRDDCPLQGPYDSLDTALEQIENPFGVSPVTEEVTCTELSAKDVAAKLQWWPSYEAGATPEGFPQATAEHRFSVNGQPWVARSRSGDVVFIRARGRAQ